MCRTIAILRLCCMRHRHTTVAASSPLQWWQSYHTGKLLLGAALTSTSPVGAEVITTSDAGSRRL